MTLNDFIQDGEVLGAFVTTFLIVGPMLYFKWRENK